MDTPRVFYPGRRALPEVAAFWVLAVLFLMLFFASAAASPLYPVYQARFRFSAATLTAVFAVYVLVLLVTLLFFGKVSDHLGRLPVIITVYSASLAALVAVAAGILLFGPSGKPARAAPASRAVMPPGPCTGPPCPRASDPSDGKPATTARPSG